jgi:hypothetical protein
MWEFCKIRQLAIDSLQSVEMDPAEKYLLARETGVDAWLIPSLRQFATREDPLSMADYERLGIECVLKLARLRECRTPGLGTIRHCQVPLRAHPVYNRGGGYAHGQAKCGGLESASYICTSCSARRPIEGKDTALDDSRIAEIFELAPLNDN